MLQVSYEFYKDIYKGQVVPEADFDKWARRNAFFVQGLIDDKLIYEQGEHGFKFAVCELSEIDYSDSVNPEKQSENIDGYSYTKAETKTVNAKRLTAIKNYCTMDTVL